MSNNITGTFKLNTRQQEAFEHLLDPDVTTLLYGGSAGGGKSALGAAYALYLATEFEGSRVLMARAELVMLKESTLITLFDIARKMSPDLEKLVRNNFNKSDNKITFPNGSEIVFRGIAFDPSDPTLKRIGGTEYTAIIYEEATEMADIQIYRTLLTRIRWRLDEFRLTPKILLTCNPDRTSWLYGQIYKPWKDGNLPPHIKYVPALLSENDMAPDSYKRLMSIENLGPEEYAIKVLGSWEHQTGEGEMFSPNDFTNAIEWDTTGFDQREKYLSIDVASKQGQDSTAILLWHGFVLSRIWKVKGLDTVQVHDMVRGIIAEHGIRIDNVIVDSNGVGAGVFDLLKGSIGFKGSNRRLNNEGHQNQRDQMFFKASEYLARGLVRIKVDRDQEHLVQELQQDLMAHKRYRESSGGPGRVVNKESVSRSLQRSPDLGDAFSMRFWFCYRSNDWLIDVINW